MVENRSKELLKVLYVSTSDVVDKTWEIISRKNLKDFFHTFRTTSKKKSVVRLLSNIVITPIET